MIKCGGIQRIGFGKDRILTLHNYLGKNVAAFIFFVGYMYKWLVVERNLALEGKLVSKLAGKDVSRIVSRLAGANASASKNPVL